MFYPYHRHFISYIHSINWGSVPEWLQFLAVFFIGIIAACIAWRQIKIQDFVEILIRPNLLHNGIWEFQIRNIGARIIYITKIESIDIDSNMLKISRNGKLSLATGENNYYSIEAPDPNQCQEKNEIRFDIEFEDHFGKKYKSHHAIWFQANGWGAQNLKAEKI